MFYLFVFMFLSVVIIIAGTTGKVKGRILDVETGEPLQGANVQIVGSSLGAATDINGFYFMLNVPPGQHDLIVTYIGYVNIQRVINVMADLTTVENINLTTAVIEVGSVTVTAERAAIQMDRTNTTSYVTAEQIENLPVQDISDLIQLQAGVIVDKYGGIHIRGGRTSDVAYIVDGIPITSQFSSAGGSLFNVETDNVQEIQIISGTFNAEYGQAQSGVINIITKDPSRQFSGHLALYGGDRFSKNLSTFPGIDELHPQNIQNFEGRIAGPLPFFNKIGIYLSGRYFSDANYLTGIQLARPKDAWQIAAYDTWYRRKFPNDPEVWKGIIEIPDSLFTGDGNIVAMDPLQHLSLNAKFVSRPFPVLRTSYSIFVENESGRDYDDNYRYTPDALKHVFNKFQMHTLSVNHTLSPRLFYTVNLNYSKSSREAYLFSDLLSPKLQTVSPERGRFNLGGTKSGKDLVETDKLLGKMDWNWQLDNYQLFKFGIEGTTHRIRFQSRSPEFSSNPNFSSNYFPSDTSLSFSEFLDQSQAAVLEPPKLAPNGESGLSDLYYEHQPLELAAYIQNTIELNELIVNLGLRYEWFRPDHAVLADPRVNPAPGSVTLTSNTDLLDVDPKFQLSPRLGIAFPISDAGVIHVAYGHFLKLPPFAYIYDNSEYKIVGLNSTIVGNPDLLPQKTVSYEVGLQQELAPGLGFEITLFYADFRNLLGLEVIRMVGNVNSYFRRVNRDYGFNRGIALAIRKTSGPVTGTLDYTFQVSKGNESDPNNIAIISTGGLGGGIIRDSEKQVLPLDWDQRHTLNGTLAIKTGNAWTFSLIGRVSSGQPYTPEPIRLDVKSKFKNTEFKPWKTNLDLYINKNVRLAGKSVSLFIRVFNLFDRANELTVYAVTGRASRDHRYPITEQLEQDRLVGLFTLRDIDNHQDWYSDPRRIQVGISLNFGDK